MRQNGIVLDVEERKELISRGVKKLAASVEGEALMPAGLLAEVANLVEKPTAVLGSFDAEFLALPEDVLISVMKKHQRYFPIRRASGKLLPHFIVVRNGDEQGLDLVRQGNEHVVRRPLRRCQLLRARGPEAHAGRLPPAPGNADLPEKTRLDAG